MLCLLAWTGYSQPFVRNFFDTNAAPIVDVLAGSNSTVQATTASQARHFTVNGKTDTNVVNILIASGTSGQTNVTQATVYSNAVITTNISGGVTLYSIGALTDTNVVNILAAYQAQAATNSLNLPLSRITQSGAVSGQVPEWNGSSWVPSDVQGVTIPNTLTKTNFVLNTVYTNTSGSMELLSSSVSLLTAGVNGSASLDLMADQSGGTSFALLGRVGVNTFITGLAQNFTNTIYGAVSNAATYYFTNSSSGAGDSSLIVSGTGTIVILSDGAAAGVASLGGNNIFTGTNQFSGGTMLWGDANKTNGTWISSFGEVVSNALGSVTISGGNVKAGGFVSASSITNTGLTSAKLLGTDSNGKIITGTDGSGLTSLLTSAVTNALPTILTNATSAAQNMPTNQPVISWTNATGYGYGTTNTIYVTNITGGGSTRIYGDSILSTNAGTGRGILSTNGNMFWSTDGGGDIGASGATRPNNIYAKAGVTSPGYDSSSALAVAKAQAVNVFAWDKNQPGIYGATADAQDLGTATVFWRNLYVGTAAVKGTVTATNGFYFPQGTNTAPTAANIGGTVGSVTNHLMKNVGGVLIDYWSDGTTLWSKVLAP